MKSERGQSTVELAISAIVLLLLVNGLLDLARVFYFDISLHGGAREGARHAAWFNPGSDTNPYLDDSDVMTSVNSALAGSGLRAAWQNGTSSQCPNTGNPGNNPPVAGTYYPTALNQPYLFICYRQPGGASVGSIATAPTDNSYAGGDVQVFVTMSYGLVTSFMQNYLGNGLHVISYAHFEIQGSPP